MPRPCSGAIPVLFAVSLGLSSAGCTTSLFSSSLFSHLDLTPPMMDGFSTEQRVITQFTDARAEDNEAAFRRVVSTRFESRALRSTDAYKDLEILDLPRTELEVVESTTEEDKSLSVVAKEDDGTKYQFRLLRDSEKRRWVVDDVLMRQQKKGTRASRSTVEVMDLLLTVREFLDIWKDADRNAVLQVVAADLREPLSELPEPWLQNLIQRIASEYESGMARRPEAQLDESDAVVKMPSKNGFLLLKVVRDADQWLVSDIEMRLRKTDDHPGSILRQARALRTTTQFLAAYAAGDAGALKSLCEPGFHQSAISIGDLSTLPLPAASAAPDDVEIRAFTGQLTIIIPSETSITKISLSAAGRDAPTGTRSTETAVESRFVVSDVTLYDRTTQRQRNLRSAFAAPARAQLFLSSLQQRDLPMVRRLSSLAFNEQAWSVMSPDLFSRMSLDCLPQGAMTLQEHTVRGEITELQFLAADGRLCGIVMKDENGSLQVDDVQFADGDARVSSFRTRVVFSVPLTELAAAWSRGDLTAVQKHTSMEFNRLVWSNVSELPTGFERLPDLLQQPVIQTTVGPEQADIQLGHHGQQTVTVRLLKEHSAWVVDEISMAQAGGTTFDLRRTLRQDIAQRVLGDPSGGITRAMYSTTADDRDNEVSPAMHATTQSRRGNLTVPSTVKPRPRTAVQKSAALDLTEDTPKKGTFYFGPDAAQKAATESARPPESPAAAETPDSSATIEQDGDVMYFRGRDATPSTTDTSEPIDDMSNHPIEIPLE